MTDIEEKPPTEGSAGDVHTGAASDLARADLELVDAILNKRADRLTAFVDRLACIPRILAARNRAMGRPLDQVDLDEVAQDALAIVWRKLPSFNGSARLETWIYRIADFELKNRVRRKAYREQRLAPVEALEHAAIEPDGTLGEDYSDVHRALEDLEPELLAVVVGKHYDGLSFSELARRLGVPEGTAKFRYYQGVGRLKVLLRHRREDFT